MAYAGATPFSVGENQIDVVVPHARERFLDGPNVAAPKINCRGHGGTGVNNIYR